MTSIDPQPDPAARASTAWLLGADERTCHNIGMRRIVALWMAGWQAAQRARDAAERGDAR